MTYVVPKPPPHVSWRDKRQDWKPRGHAPPPSADQQEAVVTPLPPPPDYNTTPVNVLRHFCGGAVRDMEIDRLYYEYNNPPTSPYQPNIVWPRAVYGFSV